MRTLLQVVAITFCITTLSLSSSSTIGAAVVQNGKSQPQEINSESACFLSDHDDGLPRMGNYCGSDCGFTKRLCCYHHPTTLSYHPEIYNYRHYFNIIGHETYPSFSNYRNLLPAANRPEEILTPLPEQENQSPQMTGSARSSGANQKKLQK
ncbi:MAG: hypothetical protein ABSA77_10165 [Thermoguttaceae bacterium]|jgi:hypothetical protein